MKMHDSSSLAPGSAPVASILTVFGLLAFSPGLQAQEDPLAGLDHFVSEVLDTWKAPGIALAVVKGDSVVLARGYGTRDIRTQEPLDERSLFAVASTSKAFTSAALGMLVDEGLLSWDDRVTEHLPEFQLYDPYVTREFTVRDLLSHRGGDPAGPLPGAGLVLQGPVRIPEHHVHHRR